MKIIYNAQESEKILKENIGIGVAGNFENHFAKNQKEPKGIFPYYVPGLENSFLNQYPYTENHISLPQYSIQNEVELALLCKVNYQGHLPQKITPVAYTLINDVSIRDKNLEKLSYTKNWGMGSKGILFEFRELDNFGKGSLIDDFSLLNLIKRQGVIHQCSQQSSVTDYLFFHEKLIDWVLEKIHHQKDEGLFEKVHPFFIKKFDFIILALGSPAYEEFGKTHSLEEGDQSISLLYNSKEWDGKHFVEQDYRGMILKQKVLT